MRASNNPQASHLTTEELRYLNSWLQTATNTSIFKAHGFLCAVICCPIQITTATWLSNLLPNVTPNEETQIYFTLLNQLYTEVSMHFSHYEVIYPLADCLPISPFEACKLTPMQRDNLAEWCQGYLDGIKIKTSVWEALKDFKNLTFVLQVVNKKEVAAKLIGIDDIHSFKVEGIITDSIESLPVLLGIIYDQACEIAKPSKENKKPKKTDINLLYHFRPGKIRASLPDDIIKSQNH